VALNLGTVQVAFAGIYGSVPSAGEYVFCFIYPYRDFVRRFTGYDEYVPDFRLPVDPVITCNVVKNTRDVWKRRRKSRTREKRYRLAERTYRNGLTDVRILKRKKRTSYKCGAEGRVAMVRINVQVVSITLTARRRRLNTTEPTAIVARGRRV